MNDDFLRQTGERELIPLSNVDFFHVPFRAEHKYFNTVPNFTLFLVDKTKTGLSDKNE
jgi:hypothetical protein